MIVGSQIGEFGNNLISHEFAPENGKSIFNLKMNPEWKETCEKVLGAREPPEQRFRDIPLNLEENSRKFYNLVKIRSKPKLYYEDILYILIPIYLGLFQILLVI